MFAYYGYKSNDYVNHLTGQPASQNANSGRFADESQLLIKRGLLFFEGTAFDPDFHYRVVLNGNTARGAVFPGEQGDSGDASRRHRAERGCRLADRRVRRRRSHRSASSSRSSRTTSIPPEARAAAEPIAAMAGSSIVPPSP
ncbi:MAG: hypothetical protein QM811_32010 [Pirellulales bacterium]